MSKSFLNVEPKELDFLNPGPQPVSINLSLTNNHNTAIAYKIKTTAPRRYCVRPNHGRVKAGMSETVEIILNSLKPEELNVPCRDKFLVLSAVDTDPSLSCDDLFKMAAKENTGEEKLKCKYSIDSALSSSETYTYSEGIRSRGFVSESPTSAGHESELARLKKINTSLKESNREIHTDIENLKTSGLRQRKDVGGPRESEPPLGGGKMAMRGVKGAQNQWVIFLAVLLLGWFVGHFIL
eukprot:CFRG5266T1